MSSQRETWYEIRDGNLWKISENDGYAYLRQGVDRTEILLCTEEEAPHAYPEELANAIGATNALRK